MRADRAEGDLLVAGHVNVDHVLRVRSFPEPDRTAPVVVERTALGGTATNVARAARAAGLRVGILARVGDGFPRRFRAALRRDGIDLRGLETVRGAPTPECTIVEDASGTTRTLIQQGPMGDGHAARAPGPWWRAYRWLHLGTGDPRYYLRLARAAAASGRHVALDPAQEILYRWDRATFRAILPLAELLFGNRAEIACAARWAGGSDAGRLVAQVPLVVRTEGSRGATAFFRGGSVHVDSRTIEHPRTLVGAGDAFRGGFYGAWCAGQPLRACLVAGDRAARRWIAGGTGRLA